MSDAVDVQERARREASRSHSSADGLGEAIRRTEAGRSGGGTRKADDQGGRKASRYENRDDWENHGQNGFQSGHERHTGKERSCDQNRSAQDTAETQSRRRRFLIEEDA